MTNRASIDPSTRANESQDPLVRALATAAFYPHQPRSVQHVQTHISHVFLAGPYVFKLKKAVRFSFLDFSTRELRQHFCEEELRLNRRLSPAIYLDVLPIVRRLDGALALGGDGEILDHVLRMRRLPSERMLPILLEQDAVTSAMMDRLAGHIAEFHARSASGPEIAAQASSDALGARWSDTVATLAPFAGTLFPRGEHALLADFGPRFVGAHAELLRARQTGSHIRDGHGDLHAEHVCFVDVPTVVASDTEALAPGIYVFDCLEFSPALRCNDVAAEIAFLTMDLELRGHRELAGRFASAYAEAARDPSLARLLPFYASARACVRATVEALTSQEPEVDPARRAAAATRARQYLELAVRCAWRAQGPMVIGCMGLSGTGKSTLAASLADLVDATVLRSDVIRKRADGATATAERYSPEARSGVYAALASEADAALESEQSVIADATYLRRPDRDRLRDVAARRGVPCVFVECRTDPTRVRQRLDDRPADDVSDARWETYLAQQREQEPLGADERSIAVDTDGGTDEVVARALRELWAWRVAAGGP
jgi:aminoglycoside phosphotransferase family enzyme/predicted kinase